jgi:hypothetical protein
MLEKIHRGKTELQHMKKFIKCLDTETYCKFHRLELHGHNDWCAFIVAFQLFMTCHFCYVTVTTHTHTHTHRVRMTTVARPRENVFKVTSG